MTDLQAGTVPELDTADRMRVAIRHAGIGVGEMAGYFGVTAHTVGAWVNGRNRPTVQTLRLWALRTGVSFEWLAGLPRLDSNQQPSGYPILQVVDRSYSGVLTWIGPNMTTDARAASDLRHTRHLRRVS